MTRKRPRIDVSTLGAGVRADRAHSEGVRVQDLGQAPTGACQYGREGRAGGYRVVGLAIPSARTARGRIIRAHELLHAAHSPGRRRTDSAFPDIVRNAAEDVHVHANGWPAQPLGHLTRDALAIALQDARSAWADQSRGAALSDETYNLGILALVRSAAMIRGAYACSADGAHRRAAARAMGRFRKQTAAAYGGAVTEAAARVVALVEQKKASAHREACQLIEALMRWPDPETEAQRARIDLGEGDDGEPDLESGKQGEGDSGTEGGDIPPMTIVRLPLRESTDPMHAKRGAARSGARLNHARAARAVASLSTAGLFQRIRRRQGGAVCIDASGSMALSPEALADLCKAAPAATVGYYSSGSLVSGAYGTLHVFATGGKRAAECPRVGGGNDVDLWAVRWLLRQPAPRFLVTDRGFCGGPIGQDIAAAVEVERAERAGLLTVFGSVDEAREGFAALK